MENTINTGAIKATFNKTTKTTRQPNPFVLALVFTTVLCFAVRPSITRSNKVVVAPDASPTALSESVADAVVKDLSKRSGLPKSELKIVDAQQLILSDRCLISKNSNFLCVESEIPGWQITVASGKKRWVYHTNKSGSMLKLDNGNVTPKHKTQRNTFANNISSVGNG
ncbi:hypothetical protein IQ264_06055 [Phormidium sp. LEGE 05292]|uniref:hypothetical protein n=1 Tax=[Phormidium] sp. LEGE 05292 TaxID=767427 RepID=UPI001882490F|nr:hypothetical protein [Phormidium sp. LEGE 05292]MBE9224998.1 hypothetical protein [Phormidium sp. LEGE 05292]